MKVNSQKKPLVVLLGLLLVAIWSVEAQDHDHGHNHDHGHAHEHEGGTALYLAEHGDFEVVFEEGELELAYHLGAGAIVDGNALDEDTEFHPEDLIVVLTEEAEILRPAGEQWDPTGVDVNEPLWVIPQVEQEGVPALGFGFDIPAGVFLDDTVTLSLLTMAGPGELSLWENDAFGQPSFLLSMHEGITESIFPNHLHAHYNWGFTAPGDYILVFEAAGNLVEGGRTSAVAIYRFKVTEEPLCLTPLPGDVNGDCIVDEHDMHIVEDNMGNTAPSWPGDHDHDHDHDHGHSDFQVPLAWIWGYDNDTEILTAYHSDGGEKRATFTAPIHTHMQIMYSPSYPQHTFWMGKNDKAIGFTAGFIPHGNHGHMVTPEKFLATSECHGCIHIGIAGDGNTVAFANDDNQSFTLIDTVTGAVTTANHGSPHSSALITDGGQLVGVHMQENWARIIDPFTDAVLAEIPIGSAAHGDAYNSATDRAFIAVDEGIEIIDIASLAKTGRLDYPGPASTRTYIMYHDPTGEIPVAVGPAYNTDETLPTVTDGFFLVHMTNETIEAITIPGATLDWSKGNGLFDLSKDGRTAVFSDMRTAALYLVDVDPSSATFRWATTISTPAAGVPVSVGAKGEHMFILSGTTVYPVDVDGGAVDMDGGFSVKEGTDWIYVTSFSGELVDESVDMGDEILNPEDVN